MTSKRADIKIVHGETKRSFNSGMVVESLQAAGVPTDKAIAIASSTEKWLRNRHETDVALDELMKRLVQAVEKQLGATEAANLRRQTPPFVPLMVKGEKKTTPFSKRTLSASLEKLELSFKDAYAVARYVEQRLRLEGYESVGQRELVHVIAQSIEALLGRDLRLKYEAQLEQPTEVLIVESSGFRLPYSRGILAQSLMTVGLDPQLSHQVAKRAEDVLWRLGTREIERDQLRRVVRGLLVQEAGVDFARRYELLRSIRRPHKPLVIMIGGASGVGKSTLATKLAYRLGISRIVSSDAVREALRSLISPELSPTLHSSSFAAWEAQLLPGREGKVVPKRKRVVRGFQMQVQQLTTALRAIVRRNVEEQVSLIMEGIHIVPGFMAPVYAQDATVIELVLSVSDEELHRNRFGKRDEATKNRRPMDKYLSHFAEIRMLQSFIVQRAKDEGVSVIDGADLDQATEQAIEVILEVVLATYPEREGEALELAGLGTSSLN